MDQIRELIMSWEIKEVFHLIKDDEKMLDVVVGLLNDKDIGVQLRALSVIDSLLSNSDNTFRRLILLKGFDSMVNLLDSKEDRVVIRTLQVLRKLVDGVPLRESQLVRLLDALYYLPSRGKTIWIGVLDLLSSISCDYCSRIESHVVKFLNSDNIWISSIGLKLAAFAGYYFRGHTNQVGSILSRILDFNDVLLLEVAFDSIVQFLTTPSQEILETLLRSAYFKLSILAVAHSDRIIRLRAREVLGLMRDAIVNYYSRRPSDAAELAKRLREEGFIDEAVLVEQIIPRYHWNASSILLFKKQVSKLPGFLREL